MPGATIVKDVDSALQAIATIVTQGEGTPTSPADSPTEYAHYYRFEELFMGMRIVIDPSSPVGYSFDPKQPIVVDDTADVTQMADNPRTVDFSSNWRAGQLADECDAIYTKLLNALHIGFNGQPDWIDRNAVSVMFEFKNCIEELLQQQLAERSLCRTAISLCGAVIKLLSTSKFPCHPVCRSRSAMPPGARPDAASSTPRAAARPSGRIASRPQRSPRW